MPLLARPFPSTAPRRPGRGRMARHTNGLDLVCSWLSLFLISSSQQAKRNSLTNIRIGCFTCRLRRKKCDENHPACSACVNLSVRCEYKRPVWWGNTEQRRLQKERIKNKIKQTKMIERSNNHSGMLMPLRYTRFQTNKSLNIRTQPIPPIAYFSLAGLSSRFQPTGLC